MTVLSPSSAAFRARSPGTRARLAELAVKHRAQLAVIADETCYGELRAWLAGTDIETAAGGEALVDAASRSADWVMAAIVGPNTVISGRIALRSWWRKNIRAGDRPLALAVRR